MSTELWAPVTHYVLGQTDVFQIHILSHLPNPWLILLILVLQHVCQVGFLHRWWHKDLEARALCNPLIRRVVFNVCTFKASPPPPDEEPEEDLTVEQMEEKAKAGDAGAQTRVSENTCTETGTWHCFQSCWLTQSQWAFVYFWLFARWSRAYKSLWTLLQSVAAPHSIFLFSNKHKIFFTPHSLTTNPIRARSRGGKWD